MPQTEPMSDQEAAELQRLAEEEEWHDQMMAMYTWDDGGNCDGFTKY